jgi:23S rRNA pseudouridine1911/1915/1917 synthase
MPEPKIIYEDENILAINKPAGLIVHGESPSVVDWLIKRYPEIKNIGEESTRPGIVHRLDRDTSGVLIIAKNQKTFEYLKDQFKSRKIKKTYLVLVEGDIKRERGVIDLPIGRSKKWSIKKLASKNARGKIREAVTEYKVLKKFSKYTLVEVYPKTGRTHQIRVHFKAISHPVVGDRLYGGNNPLGRQFLHAGSLELTLLTGERIKIEADLPEDLKNFLDMLN